MLSGFASSFIPSLAAFGLGLLIAWMAWGWRPSRKD